MTEGESSSPVAVAKLNCVQKSDGSMLLLSGKAGLTEDESCSNMLVPTSFREFGPKIIHDSTAPRGQECDDNELVFCGLDV